LIRSFTGSSSIPKAKPCCRQLPRPYPTACSNRSRKNVLSLSNVWLVFMPMNGLTFGTLASKLPGDFDFIQLKPDRRRRRNKFSDKFLFLAAKSELLPKGRSTERLRSDAAYLEILTLRKEKHVVCRRSQWAILLEVSHWELLFFGPDDVALHPLFCPMGPENSTGLRHNLPITGTCRSKSVPRKTLDAGNVAHL
jgi:hypothetical protein